MIRKALIYKNVEREIALYAVRAYLSNAVIDGHAVLSVSTSASEAATCCIRVMLGHPMDTTEGNAYTLESINHLLSCELRSSTTEVTWKRWGEATYPEPK